jgi:hypothetical protein
MTKAGLRPKLAGFSGLLTAPRLLQQCYVATGGTTARSPMEQSADVSGELLQLWFG